MSDIIYRLYAVETTTPDSSAITNTEYEVLAAFRYTLRWFMSFSESVAKEAGITQQHQALLTIKGFPGREQITFGELPERLQIKHIALSD